jgi:hypothetical protein
VLLGRGAGFGSPTPIGRGRDCSGDAAVGDVNGDGRPDVFSAGSTYPYPSTASVFLNRGHGRFVPAHYYETGLPGADSAGLVIRDLNADGRPDLAAVDGGASSVGVLTNTLGVCKVLDFSGKTRAAAKRALARVGCRVGAVSRAYSQTVAPGHVFAAEPRFGAYWPKGPEVDLVVSRGRRR